MSSRPIRSCLLAVLLLVAGCQEQVTDPTVPPTLAKGGKQPPPTCTGIPEIGSLTLSPADVMLSLDGVQQFVATNQDGEVIPPCALKWSSSNASVAAVSPDGEVTGIAVGGPVTIKAQTNGRKPKMGTASVTVDGWVQVDADRQVACGLRYTGRLYCWGTNGGSENGGLGIGVFGGAYPAPVEVAGQRRWRTFSTGYPGTCAITTDDRAYCWGNNRNGELGVGKSYEELPWSLSPIEVDGGRRWQLVAYGSGFVCGLTTDGTAYCWGTVGDVAEPRWSVPTLVPGGHVFTSLKTGAAAICGRTTAGQELCWGYLDDYYWFPEPSVVPNATALSDLTPLYWGVMCARDALGTGYCWGRNTGMGTLGIGTVSDRVADPTPLVGGLQWAPLAPGMSPHTCGVSSVGKAYCWGNNHSGELGDGTTTNQDVPVEVTGGHTWKQLASSLGPHGRGEGRNSTCGLTTAGAIYCWGANDQGQLGGGFISEPVASLVKVLEPSNP